MQAQSLKGIVTDGESSKPVAGAIVTNQATQQSTNTDEEGNFLLLARSGDIISVSFHGYHTIQRTATPGVLMHFELRSISVKLPDYEVRGLTPFQKDSLEMTELYSKELSKKKINPSVSFGGGLIVSGLIGAPVQRLSRSYKRNKRFKENLKKDMEQKYIDTRYTPVLTSALTGLSGDSLGLFMNTYPMNYTFARTAGDLELKAWIRNNYKEYSSKAVK